VYDCSGIQVDIGGNSVAYNVGIIVLIIYMLSFSLVPQWSASDIVMRFQLTAKFEGRLEKSKSASSQVGSKTTWLHRASRKLSVSSESSIEAEKRFFKVGDEVMWQENQSLNPAVVIGTVESSSVYPEQDAEKFGDFVIFVKINPTFDAPMLRRLSEAADAVDGQKPVVIDSEQNRTKKTAVCRCQLLKAPASHARFPIFGFKFGRWEIVRQLNACFQLLLLSLFPAIDTISDLVYILSSLFANYYIFAASMICFTVQFWVFVVRLKRRRVFEAFRERRINMTYLKGCSLWPKWASPDSLPVCACVPPFARGCDFALL